MPENAYNFSFDKITGGKMPLAGYSGKVLLIVNTASQCGFTGQYKSLENLYQQYKDRGLIIIGVPSDNFGGQEPGSNEEIKNFCESKFAVTFPLVQKVDVKGKNAHEFYQWAGKELGFGTKPKWNFHKYLIGKNGQLVDHFHSTTSPDSKALSAAIEKLL